MGFWDFLKKSASGILDASKGVNTESENKDKEQSTVAPFSDTEKKDQP